MSDKFQFRIEQDGVKALIKQYTAFVANLKLSFNEFPYTQTFYINNSFVLYADRLMTDLANSLKTQNYLDYRQFKILIKNAINTTTYQMTLGFQELAAGFNRGKITPANINERIFASNLAEAESKLKEILHRTNLSVFTKYDRSAQKLIGVTHERIDNLNFEAFVRLFNKLTTKAKGHEAKSQFYKGFATVVIDEDSVSVEAANQFLQNAEWLDYHLKQEVSCELANAFNESFATENIILHYGQMGGLDKFIISLSSHLVSKQVEEAIAKINPFKQQYSPLIDRVNKEQALSLIKDFSAQASKLNLCGINTLESFIRALPCDVAQNKIAVDVAKTVIRNNFKNAATNPAENTFAQKYGEHGSPRGNER